ncbi:uncharacterized protein LOC128820754 [Vidua macroura]|uniref:uncharacterized protein LOC128820754 n=1 Tax=Vidua macroura TaxID=187451 RepID=UPI0023A83C75|nr:uncharacterized protein LOC128820754 [Vidua macroura]
MAAWLPRCCFPALQGCFPAWPGCSFSPASAGRHLASAGREPKLHHGPEMPAISRSPEMKRKAVLKAAFPGGSSGPLAAPAAGSEAMPGTVTGAWDGDMAYRDALLDDSLENSLGEILLENAGGPSPWKNSDTGDKKSLEAARHLDQMLSDLERRREMNRKAVLKAAFPGGSSGPLAAPAAGSEAMPGTVTGAWDGDMAYRDALLDDSLENSLGEILLENAGGKFSVCLS